MSEPLKKLSITPKTMSFEAAVELARGILLDAGRDAAKELRQVPPTVREEKTLTGVRLVAVWPDGEETNECIVNRIDGQDSISV